MKIEIPCKQSSWGSLYHVAKGIGAINGFYMCGNWFDVPREAKRVWIVASTEEFEQSYAIAQLPGKESIFIVVLSNRRIQNILMPSPLLFKLRKILSKKQPFYIGVQYEM